MSTPITISLFCNGRQKDYKAIFTDDQSALRFKVTIDDNVVNFEGSLDKSFQIAENSHLQNKQIDKRTLEAVTQQLNQIFF